MKPDLSFKIVAPAAISVSKVHDSQDFFSLNSVIKAPASLTCAATPCDIFLGILLTFRLEDSKYCKGRPYLFVVEVLDMGLGTCGRE